MWFYFKWFIFGQSCEEKVAMILHFLVDLSAGVSLLRETLVEFPVQGAISSHWNHSVVAEAPGRGTGFFLKWHGQTRTAF